jgi:chromosomal replication initiator protein
MTNKSCEPCIDHTLVNSNKILHPEEIILSVCKLFGTPVGKLLSANKQMNYVTPRSIIADILYSDRVLTMSLKQIGRLLDNRDHTTIMHSIKNIKNRCEYDLEFREQYRQIHISLYGSDYYFKYKEKFYQYQKEKRRKILNKSKKLILKHD